MAHFPPMHRKWIASLKSPLRFVTDILGATPEPWQVEALELIGKEDRVAVRSGHGVGKTTLLAWITLWFLLTRYPSTILFTANSQDQLRDTNWPELHKWRDKLPDEFKDQIEITGERIFLKAAQFRCYGVARTASEKNRSTVA